MSTRALVTGGNGFVAQWTIRAMLERGWRVTAAGIGPMPEAPVLTRAEREAVQWLALDVTDQRGIGEALDASRPEVVMHLAAVSHVPDAEANPGRAYEVNAVGTVRLLAEVGHRRRVGTLDPVILIVGSAEQYGRHDRDAMPLGEEAEQRPLTPYAASKVAQEVAARQMFRAGGGRIVCTRSFSHSGVGHGPNFLLPGLVARALALPPTGGRLAVGNAEVVRDYLHVTDVVAAYLSLVEHGVPGEVYNVSSGDGVTVRELAAEVLRRAGRAADIAPDAGLTRAVDVPVQIGSSSKLRRVTGWSPRRAREDIIDDLIHAATR